MRVLLTFAGEVKPGEDLERAPRNNARTKANSPYIWHRAVIKPGPQWWEEVSALTAAPSLLQKRRKIRPGKGIFKTEFTGYLVRTLTGNVLLRRSTNLARVLSSCRHVLI